MDRPFWFKLGLREGHTLVALDAPAYFDELMAPGREHFTYLHRVPEGESVDAVALWLSETGNPQDEVQRLRESLTPGGAIWMVIPKKPVALRRGPRVFFDEVLAAVLPTGFVDNKDLTFSEQEYGIRFVLRRELRGARKDQIAEPKPGMPAGPAPNNTRRP